MSGGHFNYEQYRIEEIAIAVDRLIQLNDTAEWYKFSPATIDKFREGLLALRVAAVYAQRIDWLVSGDDGEESFHRRLAEELDRALALIDDVPVSAAAEWLLYEHDDGRHAVAPNAEAATFSRCDPAWHRVGPVAVYCVAAPRVRDADEPLPLDVLVDAHTDRAHKPEQLKPCTRGVALPRADQPKGGA